MKLTHLLLLLTLSSASCAAPRCVPLENAYQRSNILISARAHARVFAIQNFSKQTIYLDHPMQKDPSAKAGWSTKLSPKRWSALLLNRKNFALSCQSMRNGNLQRLDCKRYVHVCEPDVKIDPAQSASFWVTENQPEQTFWLSLAKRLL